MLIYAVLKTIINKKKYLLLICMMWNNFNNVNMSKIKSLIISMK